MISYRKYNGLGNDFVIVDYEECALLDHSALAVKLCDRETGIGADGLILVKQDPLEMIYYNSDGSRAKMCGNGIRCFARYVFDKGLTYLKQYDVETLAGTMTVHITETTPFIVEINMGKTDDSPLNIPMTLEDSQNQTYTFNDETFTASSLLMGVPHTMVEVDKLDESEMIRVGKLFGSSDIFPESTNVNFYQVIDNSTVKIQTYERGAGLTLACGTGACATFSLLYHQGIIENNTTFTLTLGDLNIKEVNEEIFMRGPAEFEFEGSINEEDIV